MINKDYQKKIKKEVRRLRMSTGLVSQDEFIKEYNIQCSRGTYNKYESGDKDIKVGLLLEIIGSHKLTLFEFVDGIDV